MNHSEIAEYLKGIEQEAKQIKDESIKMSWFMRGGVTYEQILMMSINERKTISEIIKDNYETTKKSGLPHF